MRPLILTALFAVVAPSMYAAQPQMMGQAKTCAMTIKGADLKTADTPEGISIAITTTSGDVAELRRRVEAMGKMHSPQGMMQGKGIAFTVKYEEIPNGALLSLAPKDPNQLAEFRELIRKHAEKMKKGDCTLMEDMMRMMGTVKAPDSKPEAEPKAGETDHSAHHPDAGSQ